MILNDYGVAFFKEDWCALLLYSAAVVLLQLYHHKAKLPWPIILKKKQFCLCVKIPAPLPWEMYLRIKVLSPCTNVETVVLQKRNEKRKDVQNEGHHLVTVMLQQWVIQMSWDNRKEEKVVSKQASSIWKRKTVAAS